MLKETDDLSWYARRAARLWSGGGDAAPGEQEARAVRLEKLLSSLRAAGVKGDPASMTFYTKRVPPGCRGCLKGQGTNVYVTGLCTRDCFFCFNQKPRRDELVVHGIPVKTPEEGAEVVRRYGLKSVGLSGGEPLLRPERVLGLLRALRALPGELRIDLYTNGDKATEPLLRELREAGLDSVRFDLAARDYDCAPVAMALRVFREVAVEIPVVPEDSARLRKMVDELDALRLPYLNLHELFVLPENRERVLAEGRREGAGEYKHLLWRPTADSAEAALELVLYAARCRTLSAYLCSCGTQELISKRGFSRRLKVAAEASV